MKEVTLLAHGVGKSQEVQLILGMSQTECSNKLIGFDLLVSLFSLICILSWLVVEMLKSEAWICSFLIPMFPKNKGDFSVSSCWYFSLQKNLYWPFLFGPNLALIFCPHSYVEQVWKKASVCFDTQKKTCTEKTLLKMSLANVQLFISITVTKMATCWYLLFYQFYLIWQVLTDRFVLWGISYLLLHISFFFVNLLGCLLLKQSFSCKIKRVLKQEKW